MEEKKFNRNEIAIVKRCYANTKILRKKKEKLEAKRNALNEEITRINNSIEQLDAPARTLCGLDSEAFLIQQGILTATTEQENNETTTEAPEAPATEQPAEGEQQPEAEEEKLTE